MKQMRKKRGEASQDKIEMEQMEYSLELQGRRRRGLRSEIPRTGTIVIQKLLKINE